MMKKRNKTRILVMLLSLLMLFASCKGEPSQGPAGTGTKAPQATTAPTATSKPTGPSGPIVDEYVEPNALISFAEEEDAEQLYAVKNFRIAYFLEEGALCLTSREQGASAFSVPCEGISADENIYIALRIKVEDPSVEGAFLAVACDGSGGELEVNGIKLEKQITYLTSDEWQTVVLNYKVGNGTDDKIDRYYSGDIQYLRIGAWSNAPADTDFYINSIGFYHDRKAATQFCGVGNGAEELYKEVTKEDLTVTLQNGSAQIALWDTKALLTNPGMGWDFCYHSNNLNIFASDLKEGDYLDDFPCDIVYFRLGWADVEKSEGIYDWSVIDDAAREWAARGKRIAIRFCAVFPEHQNTPLWVRDAGCAGTEYNGAWLADYNDPIFKQKLENFVAAAAAHYKNADYPIEFIDVGSLGSWGEGHNLGSEPAEITTALRIEHMALWKKYFPDTLLLVGDDMLKLRIEYNSDGSPVNCYDEEALQYALDNGFGLFDDSIQVGMSESSNGYRGNIEMAELFWERVPVSAETHPGTYPTENYLDAVNQMHASYVRIHLNPYTIMDSPYTRAITLRAGYRIVSEQLNVEGFAGNNTATFTLRVKNYGAAPCYAGGKLQLTVVDAAGNTVGKTVSTFDVKDLHVGETLSTTNATDVALQMQLPQLAAGEYQVLLSVVDDGGNALYNLPVGIETETEKSYCIGILQYNG